MYDLSIIVLVWQDESFLRACLQSISDAQDDLQIELVLVQNGVSFDTADLTDLPLRVIRNPQNRGVAPARNQGLQVAQGRNLLLLDADTVLARSALVNLVRFMDEHPDVGLAGPRLEDADGNLQLTCRKLPTVWSKLLRRMPGQRAKDALADEMLVAYDHRTPQAVDYVIGACQIIRRHALEQVGLLDEAFFYGPEDVDYCVRMWQYGWCVMYVPQAVVTHNEQRLTRQRTFSKLSLIHAAGLARYFWKYKYAFRRPEIATSDCPSTLLRSAQDYTMQSPNRLTESLAAAPRVPRWSLQRSQIRWTLVVGDLVLVNLAALAALWLGIQRSTWWLAVGAWDSFSAWFVFLSLLWVLCAAVMDLYDLRIAGTPRRAVSRTLGVVLGTLAVYLVVYFFAAPQTLPRHLIVFFAVIAAGLLAVWRGLFALALGTGPLARRVVVVGGGESAAALLRAIREHAAGYYRVVASFDPAAEGELSWRSVQGLDEVIVSAHEDLNAGWLAAVVAWREQGVQIVNMAALYEELTGRVPVEHVGKYWSVLLPLEQDATQGLNGALKRGIDIVLAGVALLVAAFFLPFVALAIRLNGRGAIFLRQPRVGKNGRVFQLYKFRTMVPEAEPPGVAVWAEEDDPRVTRVGKFLRRFKIDEMPQFWNVLRGEMSLVGPRPERPEIVDNLQREIPFYRLRHVIRPGMTGWAAIRFRYGRSVNDALVKLQYDLYYLKHQSPLLDALILARTLGAVLVPPKVE